ncbi:hypothetical protein GA0070616_3087 [Micromonospora nigra]|uniref:Uncharacterized protein n=1 Tax=Micromonospora nigra TaxID=145857 RepID=A0A1C6S7R9_9ACTN|nr:hypothetical protein [Micromonospora nigra]SCL25338.1 hypothetical protein GA0070616_3087 [Micromonospora nigra]
MGSLGQRIKGMLDNQRGRDLARRRRRRTGDSGNQQKLQQFVARVTDWSGRRR